MLAERTYEVLGQLVTLVHISANLADIALFTCGFGLRLDIVLVVGIGHGLLVGKHSCFGDGADEHSVGIKVDILLNLQRHKCVDIFRQENKAVVRAKLFLASELVSGSSAPETEGLKHLERSINGQAVDVHNAGLLYNMMGVILLVDADCNSVRSIGYLSNGVDNETVVLFAVVGGDNIQAVADVEQRCHIVLVGGVV